MDNYTEFYRLDEEVKKAVEGFPDEVKKLSYNRLSLYLYVINKILPENKKLVKAFEAYGIRDKGMMVDYIVFRTQPSIVEKLIASEGKY